MLNDVIMLYDATGSLESRRNAVGPINIFPTDSLWLNNIFFIDRYILFWSNGLANKQGTRGDAHICVS